MSYLKTSDWSDVIMNASDWLMTLIIASDWSGLCPPGHWTVYHHMSPVRHPPHWLQHEPGQEVRLESEQRVNKMMFSVLDPLQYSDNSITIGCTG